MTTIHTYITEHYLTDKSDKSLINILLGNRTHQTYFDAVIQDLLPLYEYYHDYSYDDVHRLYFPMDDKYNENRKNNNKEDIIVLYPFFYKAAETTFLTFQLLIQTVSEYQYGNSRYIPLTNQFTVQQQVKQLFLRLKNNDEFTVLFEEVSQLLNDIETLLGHCHLKHLLKGHDVNPISLSDISEHYGLTMELLQWHMICEKNMMMHLLKNGKYGILSCIYYRLPLHNSTHATYELLKKGLKIEQIAGFQQIKVYTVQDHILEILIKDYPLDVSQMISHDEIELIKPLLFHQKGRLKYFHSESDVKDYFKIKLAIVLIKKGINNDNTEYIE